MPKRVEAWYDRRWLLPTIAIFTLISAPFQEDIRKAVPAGVGVMLEDWFFDFLLTGGMIGLAVVLILKSDRATRACEDLRQRRSSCNLSRNGTNVSPARYHYEIGKPE